MNIEELRNYCLSKSGTTEEFPFDKTTLVFKVMGKIYALTDLESDLSINLKCLPERAIELREQHRCVLPGYHMNKKHWNTVVVDGSVSDRQIEDWIDHSYTLVAEKLSRKQKEKLSQL